VRLDKLNVLGTFSLDLNKIGQSGGATLPDALEHLQQQSGRRPLALLIDEAHHTLREKEMIWRAGRALNPIP
jgi:hypothetical protein